MVSSFYAFDLIRPLIMNLISYASLDVLDYYLKYIKEGSNYESGVRLDFLVFTLFFTFISYLNYLYNNTRSSLYLLYCYIILSFPFMLLGFISYSDRLLLPAWMLIPIVVTSFIFSKVKASSWLVVLILIPIILVVLFSSIYKVGLI